MPIIPNVKTIFVSIAWTIWCSRGEKLSQMLCGGFALDPRYPG